MRRPPPASREPSRDGPRYHSTVRARPSSNGTDGTPAEFVQTLARHAVAKIVAGAVGHERHQRLVRAHQAADRTGEVRVRQFEAVADVEDIAGFAVMQRGDAGGGPVGDVEPFARLAAVVVDGERPAFEGGGGEDRDRLLRVLPGPERVGAAHDPHRQAVGDAVGASQEFGRRLARRVRAARTDRRSLVERCPRARSGRRPRRSRPAGAAGRASGTRRAPPACRRRWSTTNSAGPLIERSTCVSAAAWITRETSATSGATTEGSATSPCTNRRRSSPSCWARLAFDPA